MSKTLTPELRDLAVEIRGYAKEFGLDFFEVIFELLDYDEMNMVVSYGGFPTRYPHWRFGMQYEEFAKTYSYGLAKVYELVINNDPCYAYLLTCNELVDQKLVMAHVYGHSDFFKMNYWFSKTNRKMMDEMANHGVRIRRYIDRHGLDKVEDFIDTCLSVENLIDYHSPFIVRRNERNGDGDDGDVASPPRLKSKSYMEEFINPPEYLEAEQKRTQEQLDTHLVRVQLTGTRADGCRVVLGVVDHFRRIQRLLGHDRRMPVRSPAFVHDLRHGLGREIVSFFADH